MTREEAIEIIRDIDKAYRTFTKTEIQALDMSIKALEQNERAEEWYKLFVEKLDEQEPIDKSAMMYNIYMKGVNMTGEYQGCWVRFKDIEKIVDKYIGSEE